MLTGTFIPLSAVKVVQCFECSRTRFRPVGASLEVCRCSKVIVVDMVQHNLLSNGVVGPSNQGASVF